MPGAGVILLRAEGGEAGDLALVLRQRGRCPATLRLPWRMDAVQGPLRKNGETVEQEVFAFLTTEPNELTASINHERMPVLLSDTADFETWLSGPAEEALRLARSYAAEKMRIVQSGSEREDLLGGRVTSAP
jgi:hypothetical protein